MEEMNEVVLEQMLKGLNFEEKEFVKKYRNICEKLYRKGMIDCFKFFN